MSAGRPIENIYEKWIKGKEEFILAACRDGATVEDLCRLIGCGKVTFHKIKKEFFEFNELLKEGRTVADYKVEAALFKRACGFEYEEEVKEVKMDANGSAEQVISVKKTKKIVPPDTGAAMAWLKNRMPEKWRDKHEIQGDFSFQTFLIESGIINDEQE
jgi:transposase-like protein